MKGSQPTLQSGRPDIPGQEASPGLGFLPVTSSWLFVKTGHKIQRVAPDEALFGRKSLSITPVASPVNGASDTKISIYPLK
jgi:hypothetical protein